MHLSILLMDWCEDYSFGKRYKKFIEHSLSISRGEEKDREFIQGLRISLVSD